MILEFDLTWQGMDIYITCEPNWLNGSYTHIEIRCKEPLPITNTGYRSHFMAAEELERWKSIEAFILAWLEEASHSKDWQRIWKARQQLSFGF